MQLQGNVFDYFLVFGAGVAVSFTPCVYPALPVVASIIAGVNTRGTKLMGFVISLVYVLGMAVIYCGLAVVAALTRSVFGQFQNSPLVLWIVGNVLLIFALVMLDVIPLPGLALNRPAGLKPRNLWSVFVMGGVGGLIVGPCTAPVLGTVLLYVASKQNLVHAVSLLFVFSCGVGASLVLVGTFSGLLSQLPKSGPWLNRIKQLCALVLIALAEYYLMKAGQSGFTLLPASG
ncbi:MAG TPA: cytochrome c biogenesis protein CcdA [Candidatus Omnitrophota bacterium]|nr:cytochrome c biogenesis protein CcdA [Candidatus Omnitrophota bacterium]HQO58303.1 cytochrome c biogenesis protein CcdA [Candidatus Omnitrophota bacterium]